MKITVEKIMYDEILKTNRIVQDFLCLDKIIQASRSNKNDGIAFLCEVHHPSQNETFCAWVFTDPHMKEIFFCDNPLHAIEIASTHEIMKPLRCEKIEENFQTEMFDFIRKNRFFKYEITLYSGKTYCFSNKAYTEYGFFTKEL